MIFHSYTKKWNLKFDQTNLSSPIVTVFLEYNYIVSQGKIQNFNRENLSFQVGTFYIPREELLDAWKARVFGLIGKEISHLFPPIDRRRQGLARWCTKSLGAWRARYFKEIGSAIDIPGGEQVRLSHNRGFTLCSRDLVSGLRPMWRCALCNEDEPDASSDTTWI